ncbi:MAG: 3-methyl-2-oxobutanoate hydroxymethyltransferase [Nocardioidaceae bacterium]|nr:3-methyl-2-oxobutanoate hydroxymethyltransferase [Nocardioidaceae bacterium]NUS49462.1 3-methyl-2-oxobutanoate hydroxymethyltransferase [Nocardioidaceae bacterium]
MQMRPVLLNSCARAASAAEARFRIDVPIAPSRATRVVALDEESEAAVRRVAEQDWHHARFYSVGGEGLELTRVDGATVPLVDELDGVDATVLVASSDHGAEAAATIGAACTVRGIMTAGLVLTTGASVAAALTALRPHARVLLVPAEEEDLAELLRAIRA